MTTERIDVQDDGRRCHCCGETLDRCRETYRGSTAPATAIDVLAVMDRLLAVANEETEDATAYADGHDARAAVAELIEADHEYEAARRDWDHVTAHDPEETSEETWQRVADRFEAAVMRRAAALARVGGA